MPYLCLHPIFLNFNDLLKYLSEFFHFKNFFENTEIMWHLWNLHNLRTLKIKVLFTDVENMPYSNLLQKQNQ